MRLALDQLVIFGLILPFCLTLEPQPWCRTLLLGWHGGPAGVRDAGLLASALARPRQLDAYGDAADVADLAAAYTADLVQNHPFIDGNKRTGFVIGVLFL